MDLERLNKSCRIWNEWKRFLEEAGIRESDRSQYAEIFVGEAMETNMLIDLHYFGHQYYTTELHRRGIKMGDILRIFQHAQELHEKTEGGSERDVPKKLPRTKLMKQRASRFIKSEFLRTDDKNIAHRMEIEMLSDFVDLERDYNDSIQYKAIFGIRAQAERLERLLFSSCLTPKPNSHLITWQIILEKQDHPYVKQLLARLRKIGMSKKMFCELIQQAYSIGSDRVRDASLDDINEEMIESGLRKCGIYDTDSINAIKVIAEPFGVYIDNKTEKSDQSHRLRIVRMRNVPVGCSEAQIKKFFTTQSPVSINLSETRTKEVVLAEFPSLLSAVAATIENKVEINGREIFMSLDKAVS